MAKRKVGVDGRSDGKQVAEATDDDVALVLPACGTMTPSPQPAPFKVPRKSGRRQSMLAHAAAVPADDGTASGGQFDGAPVQASPLPTPADLLPIFKQQVSAGLQKQYSMDPADAAAVADTVTMGPDVFPFNGAQLAALATCSPRVSAASVEEVLSIDVLDSICTSAFASKGSNFACAVMQRAGVTAAYARYG